MKTKKPAFTKTILYKITDKQLGTYYWTTYPFPESSETCVPYVVCVPAFFFWDYDLSGRRVLKEGEEGDTLYIPTGAGERPLLYTDTGWHSFLLKVCRKARRKEVLLFEQKYPPKRVMPESA